MLWLCATAAACLFTLIALRADAQQPRTAPPGSPTPGTPGAAADAPLPAGPPIKLSDVRWQEYAYGLSLLPPEDCRLVRKTAAEHLLSITDETERYVVNVKVSRSTRSLTLEEVLHIARDQMNRSQPDNRPVVSQELAGDPKAAGKSDHTAVEKLQVDGRDAVLFYYLVPALFDVKALDRDTRPKDKAARDNAMIGQAILQVDSFTFVILSMTAETKDAQIVMPMFKSMLQSVRMADLKALNEQRTRAAAAGQKWRMNVTAERLRASLIPIQRFRLVKDNKDIGFMSLEQSAGQMRKQAGVRAIVRAYMDDKSVRTIVGAEYFLSDDDENEYWTNMTTVHASSVAAGGKAAGQGLKWDACKEHRACFCYTFTEKGIRTGRNIAVTLEAPNEFNPPKQYNRPAGGYLSLLDAWVLPQIMTLDSTGKRVLGGPREYGYYWYNSSMGRMTWRNDKLVPIQGGFVLLSREAPNSLDLRGVYTAEGALKEKQLANGLKLLAADKEYFERLKAGAER